MTYNYPQVGRSAVELLEQLGCEVILADKVCCGRPMISKGLVEDARKCAKHNVEVLKDYAAQNIPIIGCEPSCLLTLRDEYLDLLKGEAVKTVATPVVHVGGVAGEDAGSRTMESNSTAQRQGVAAWPLPPESPHWYGPHWCAA